MPNAFIIAGLGYGDEGKGTIVDFLTKHLNAKWVVRYNGGAQAAHNVILDDGTHHTFSQFGSGTFHGAYTFLSKFVIINPITMLKEAEVLKTKNIKNPLVETFVDLDCYITTPYHVYANQLREIRRGNNRHGSCGLGVNETIQNYKQHLKNTILARHIFDVSTLREKLNDIRSSLADQFIQPTKDVSESEHNAYHALIDKNNSILESTIKAFWEWVQSVSYMTKERWKHIIETEDLIFEGAQGVLLDMDYGYFPYVTHSKTTFSNALNLLGNYDGHIYKWGVTRTYQTRHGNGPFITEIKDVKLIEQFNDTNTWQGDFRTGLLDLVALKYAVKVCNGIDGLIITHIDKITDEQGNEQSTPICAGYLDRKTNKVEIESDIKNLDVDPMYTNLTTDEISKYLNTKIVLKSFSPKTSDKILLYRI